MKKLLSALMSPQSDTSKAFRDGIFAALAVGTVAFLDSLQQLDVGAYQAIFVAVTGFIIAWVNRAVRP